MNQNGHRTARPPERPPDRFPERAPASDRPPEPDSTLPLDEAFSRASYSSAYDTLDLPGPVRVSASTPLAPSSRRAAPNAHASKAVVGVWALLAFFVVGCVAARLGGLLTLAFTPLALLAAAFFYFKSPRDYVRLVVLLWLFSPFIRRIADFFSSYTESSPVLISPFLVSGLAGLCIFRKEIYESRYLAFAVAGLGVVYGALVGVVSVHGSSVYVDAIRWTIPLLFGLFCAVEGREDPSLLSAMLQTTMWSAVVMAVYGVAQFVFAPPWDVMWLTNVQMGGEGSSFGAPVPFGIRLFSTAGSPALASCMLAAGFVIAFGSRSRWMYPIMIVTGGALVLTMVRAEWAALLVMMAMLFFRATHKEKVSLAARLGVTIAVLVMCMLPAVKTDWGGRIVDRFSSFGSVKDDHSYRERSLGVARAWSMLPSQPFGKGVGFLDSDAFKRTPLYTIDGVGAHDIGALEVLFELGFMGALLYGVGMYFVSARLARTLLRGRGEELVVAVLALNTVLLFVSTNPLTSFEGVLFWAAAGFLNMNWRKSSDSAVSTADIHRRAYSQSAAQ